MRFFINNILDIFETVFLDNYFIISIFGFI